MSSSSGDNKAPSSSPAPANQSFDEHRWVIQIRSTLDDDDNGDATDIDGGVAVSVFNVPKPLRLSKPEAFTPQIVSLGPYHHWRPELVDMEWYKLSAAKRLRAKLLHLPGGIKKLVEAFADAEPIVRAHYHRYLDYTSETLSWMMAVDSSFLLEFLQLYAVDRESRPLRRVPSRLSHLVDSSGRRLGHNLILRDIMMLENQLPLFLIRKILELQHQSADAAAERLAAMVGGLMKELSPFKLSDGFNDVATTVASADQQHPSHLLEILYCTLVPKKAAAGDDAVDDQVDDGDGLLQGDQQKSFRGGAPEGSSSAVRQLVGVVWRWVWSANGGTVSYVKRLVVSKPVELAKKLPWKMLSSVPGVSVLAGPMERMFAGANAGEGGSSTKEGSVASVNKPPKVEEIMIPSATELAAAGVRFSPTGGDLTTVSFDAGTRTLYLPVVSLESNTEVVLRNLVAYEASAAPGPLVLARFVELMNGIIDTEEDVRVLRGSGVVRNRMKSDGEAAELWNGMNRAVRLTRVPHLDRTIDEVNRFYGGRWSVRTGRFMRRYVFGSWQFLTFVAAVLLLLLNAMQAVCSVYSCSASWFGIQGPQQP